MQEPQLLNFTGLNTIRCDDFITIANGGKPILMNC